MAETRPLIIRHQILMDGDGYIVREHFGAQAPIDFVVPTRAAADAFVQERRRALLEMVAAISDDAARAVADAREVDNLKAGYA